MQKKTIAQATKTKIFINILTTAINKVTNTVLNIKTKTVFAEIATKYIIIEKLLRT